MDKPTKRTQCFPCTTCDSGLKVKQSCAPTSDTVCGTMEGFFCVDPTKSGCAEAQKHKSCDPGQYISSRGTASTDSQCSACSSGTFSDGTLTSCQPHTQCESENLQLIKAGTSSADAECGENTSNRTGVAVAVSVFFSIIIHLKELLLPINQPQYVRTQSTVSGRVVCSTGVPQGKLLAPFLLTSHTADSSDSSVTTEGTKD
ncbi:tumor necrosis factor receptor superfamily member 5-like [Odontesthes bonariensis]